jgi:hypothetical protein
MELKIKNPQLEKLDKEMFEMNKKYSLAIDSLGRIPNLFAVKEVISDIKILSEGLSKIKTKDEFEILVIKDYLLNLDAQRAYLQYFTTADKENLDQLFSLVLGEDALEIIKGNCQGFDYKKYWEFFLSYQDYLYKQIPSDEETFRERFKQILQDLKKDLLEYSEENLNFGKDYEFDLILSQPYISGSFFHPTNKRMETSPNTFFVFKDESEIKINVCQVISTLFHEIAGHARHEFNSRDMPLGLQDNSINTSIAPLHVHFEGLAQTSENQALDFMRKNKKEYLIEDGYIRQEELSESSKSANNLWIYYQYLNLKKLEQKDIDIEKQFKSLINNHGLFILFTNSKDSPLSCIKNATYPVGVYRIEKIMDDLKTELGEEKFKKNKGIINEALSTGVWNFRVLPDFVRLFLKEKGVL